MISPWETPVVVKKQSLGRLPLIDVTGVSTVPTHVPGPVLDKVARAMVKRCQGFWPATASHWPWEVPTKEAMEVMK